MKAYKNDILSISNFKLNIESGQYWITQNDDDKYYPILMTPYYLVKLFEVEGLELTPNQFDDESSVTFKKAVLKRTNSRMWGLLMGEEEQLLTPYECWV